MKRMYKRLFDIVFILVCLLAFNIMAFAQGTTTINVSKNNPAVGDSVTISISATESGSITIKYTSSMLSFSSCSVSGYTSEGNSVTFSGTSGDVVFSAASEGTASIIVSSTANSGSSTTLTIGGSSDGSASSSTANTNTSESESAADSSNANTSTVSDTEDSDISSETQEISSENISTEEVTTTSISGVVGTLNSEGGFDINGTAYVVSERYTDSEMPAGFSKVTVKIGSSTYSEPTNGDITLLYLKPADNTAGSGVFYVYDEAAGTVSEFLMLSAGDGYVIISNLEAGPSSSFMSTTLEVTGGTATAYTIDGSDFYYIYGTNQDGAIGWYVYDNAYGTISRFDESTLALSTTASTNQDEDDTISTNDVSGYTEKLDLYRKAIMALIILCVILIFVIINRAIKGRGDDDDVFDGDIFANTSARPSKRMPRSIVFGSRDDEDEEGYEDDDEEYYDDEDYDEDGEGYEDEDAPRTRSESESYESKRASSLNMMDLNDL